VESKSEIAESGDPHRQTSVTTRWADEWQMKFNVSKCKVMHTGPSNDNYLYSMNGQTLNEVAEHKDLGITVSSDLKVANHCQHACSKANRMLSLIKRTIKHKSWYNYTKAWLDLIWSIVHQPGTPITIKIGPCWRGYNIDSQCSSLS